MPGFNKSGPEGNGPMTGRGMGICNAAVPGYGNQYAGAGSFARGPGMRQGRRRRLGSGMRGTGSRGFARRRVYDAGNDPLQDTAGEIQMLKAQADSVKNTLDTIYRRMAELGKNND